MTTPLINIEHFDLPKLERLEILECEGFDWPRIKDIKLALRDICKPGTNVKILADEIQAKLSKQPNSQFLNTEELFEYAGDKAKYDFRECNVDCGGLIYDQNNQPSQGCMDMPALTINRGDIKLTISTYEMINTPWQFDMNSSSYCFFSGINTHVAAINREWIGGDALATWYIDFRTKIPEFFKADDGFFWLRGIAELGSGELVIWNDEGYYTLDNQTFDRTEVDLGKVYDECDVLFKDLKDPWLLS